MLSLSYVGGISLGLVRPRGCAAIGRFGPRFRRGLGGVGRVHTGGKPPSRAAPARACHGAGVEDRSTGAGQFRGYLKIERLGCPPATRESPASRCQRGRARRRRGVRRALGEGGAEGAGFASRRGVVVERGETKEGG